MVFADPGVRRHEQIDAGRSRRPSTGGAADHQPRQVVGPASLLRTFPPARRAAPPLHLRPQVLTAAAAARRHHQPSSSSNTNTRNQFINYHFNNLHLIE